MCLCCLWPQPLRRSPCFLVPALKVITGIYLSVIPHSHFTESCLHYIYITIVYIRIFWNVGFVVQFKYMHLVQLDNNESQLNFAIMKVYTFPFCLLQTFLEVELQVEVQLKEGCRQAKRQRGEGIVEVQFREDRLQMNSSIIICIVARAQMHILYHFEHEGRNSN